MEVVLDDEVARRWNAYETGQASTLEGIDRMRLNNQINMTFANYEKAYFDHQYGVLGDSEWTRYERQICINQTRLKGLPDLKADMETVVTNEFVEYMEDLCSPEY